MRKNGFEHHVAICRGEVASAVTHALENLSGLAGVSAPFRPLTH
jgi:hypothetical protein